MAGQGTVTGPLEEQGGHSHVRFRTAFYTFVTWAKTY